MRGGGARGAAVPHWFQPVLTGDGQGDERETGHVTHNRQHHHRRGIQDNADGHGRRQRRLSRNVQCECLQDRGHGAWPEHAARSSNRLPPTCGKPGLRRQHQRPGRHQLLPGQEQQRRSVPDLGRRNRDEPVRRKQPGLPLWYDQQRHRRRAARHRDDAQ